MIRAVRLVAALALVVVVPAHAATPPQRWQSDVAAADHKRLARLWEAWTRALAEAEGRSAPALDALGPFAVPDAATMNANAADRRAGPPAGPLPGPGAYTCRTVRIGSNASPAPAGAVQAEAPVPCRIEVREDGLWFEQDEGPRRLGGRLYPDGDRLVFLGTTTLIGEMGIMPYGTDPERNAIGALRALGPAQWRLELPWPEWQSTLDLVELTPR